ncbi:DHHW family protein [Lederbergia panacisoli]|uniref:DHHW family protein n=1 Tax=Lederbergia panacisoli TaxID=1255251 RepID=UPI00214CD610|nr:DHHW family protein [Lederbergia panacisoli]MCR2820092.1 DHHW family protein [Lederbergia panacisoli]
MHVTDKIIAFMFISFIGIITILNMITDDIFFSEQENRILNQKPTFSLENILSGKFMDRYESYISDQFAWKKSWLQIKAVSEKAILKQESNGIYFGKDGFLLEGYKEPKAQLHKNIEYINYFAEKNKDIDSYVLLAPTSIEIHKEKLPIFAQSYSQRAVMDEVNAQLLNSVQFIDVSYSLRNHGNEEIFFKTDHHWTMRGAYYAYIQAAQTLGFEPYSIGDFELETVSDDFYGTYASKVLGHPVIPDSIELFKPLTDPSYKIQYEDNKELSNSLFEWSFLKKKDQYSFFLNGNHSLVTIKSNIRNGRKLAVIKDSYAHAFIPFLANHFEEIVVIDLRYFHKDVHAFIRENDVKEVLFLYNVVNFTTDSNLIWLKK